MSQTISVFVNNALVRVSDQSTVLDAVRAWNADAAREVEQGTRLVTDSRGLPIASDARVHGGAIFRLMAARDRDSASDPASDAELA